MTRRLFPYANDSFALCQCHLAHGMLRERSNDRATLRFQRPGGTLLWCISKKISFSHALQKNNIVQFKHVFKLLRNAAYTLKLKELNICIETIDYPGRSNLPKLRRDCVAHDGSDQRTERPMNSHQIAIVSCTLYRFQTVSTEICKNNLAAWQWTLKRLTFYLRTQQEWARSDDQFSRKGVLFARIGATVQREPNETRYRCLQQTSRVRVALGAPWERSRPIEYWLCFLTSAESVHVTTERERLAIVSAMLLLRLNLEWIRITIVTDHGSLKWRLNLRTHPENLHDEVYGYTRLNLM